MARLTSKEKLGFLPIEPHHHEAIISLIAPATTAHRLLYLAGKKRHKRQSKEI